MSIVFSDAFTVGANVALESYPSGAPDYAAINGGNNLYVIAAAGNVQSSVLLEDTIYRITDAAVPTGDQEISASVGVRDGYDGGYLAVRCSAGGNCYALARESAAQFGLYRVDGGTFTSLQSYSVSTADNSTHALKLRAVGTGATVTLTATINAAQQTAVNDSSANRKTSGTPGIAIYQAAANAGNFVDSIDVDNLVSGIAGVSTQSYAVLSGSAAAAVPIAASAAQAYAPVGGSAAAAVEVRAATPQSYAPLAGANATTVRVAGTSTGGYAYLGVSGAGIEVKGASPQSYAALAGTAQAVIGAAPIAAASAQSYAPVTGAVTAGVDVKAATAQTYAAVAGTGVAAAGVAAVSPGSYAYLGAGQAGIEVRGSSVQPYAALGGVAAAVIATNPRFAASAAPYAALSGATVGTAKPLLDTLDWAFYERAYLAVYTGRVIEMGGAFGPQFLRIGERINRMRARAKSRSTD